VRSVGKQRPWRAISGVVAFLVLEWAADPAKLMERYFDAHVYFANWGTHRLMLRTPKARTDAFLQTEGREAEACGG